MKISVFGSGGWGTAVSMLLHENGNEVTLWSAFESEAAELSRTRRNPLLTGVFIPAGIEITSDIGKAAGSMEFAVIATPSFAVRSTAEKLRGKISEDCIVLCISKGIEQDSSMRFSEILEEVLGENAKIASLSGPSHAEEVSRRIPTGCVAASKCQKTAKTVQDIFSNDFFRVYTSDDVLGVELGAAMKNVIALASGVCDGLGYGDNTIALLMTRGIAEMTNLCVALGGRKETLAGLAGMGDLIVTCTSNHSRNRRAGVLIGEGLSAQEAMKQVGAVVEGYYAAQAAYTLGKKANIELPIVNQTYAVLFENKPGVDAISDLMRRERRAEFEPSSAEAMWV